MFDWTQDPHRRFNPLTREWVLVSPHRTRPPLAGAGGRRGCRRAARITTRTAICAPATRAPAGCAIRRTRPPLFSITISPRSSRGRRWIASNRTGCCVAESEPGLCRVVCFSPRHNLTIANMERRRPAEGGGHLGGAVSGTRRAARDQLRTDLRESRRDDGREQSAPALPDLVEPRGAQRGRERAGVAAGLARAAGHVSVVRVRASWNLREASAWSRRTRRS